MNHSAMRALRCWMLMAAVGGVTGTAQAAVQMVTPSLDGSEGALDGGGVALSGEGLVVSSERHGLLRLNADGEVLARAAGPFDGLDLRESATGSAHVITIDESRNEAVLFELGSTFSERLRIPSPDRALEGLCLHTDGQGHLHGFLLGDDATATQWLLGTAQGVLDRAVLERRFALPPGAEFCSVDDSAGLLYVTEPDIGVWTYPASAEAPTRRTPVDLVQPFGDIDGSPSGVGAFPGGVVIADAKEGRLLIYKHEDGRYSRVTSLSSSDAEPEAVSAQLDASGKHLRYAAYDAREDNVVLATAPWSGPRPKPLLPVIAADRETEAVEHPGDAADDPAIWIDAGRPDNSRILGTNKKSGLEVYELSGRRLQQFDIGPLNNVDLRGDLAAATKRDDHSLAFFRIDGGHVEFLGTQPTDLPDIYGLCMYAAADGTPYVFANDKSGRFVQYRITLQDDRVSAEAVRSFSVSGQPEGCVVDDRRHRIFFGEEDVGVWLVSADPQSTAKPKRILSVGGALVADVEGLALYHGEAASYLIVSSQGNDSYLVYEADAPWTLRGAFRIGIDAAAGVDGASETDGLEVLSTPLGPDWPAGLMVVQDGRNVMPPQPQNFKLLSWDKVARTLELR